MKKLTLSILALILTAGVSLGQLRKVDDGGTPDEGYIPESRMEQHEAFLDGEYRMPAKPRNMWALGVEGGFTVLNGDVDSDFGFNGGLSLRKALGYSTSLRFGVNYLRPQGRDEDLKRVNNYKSSVTGLPVGTEYFNEYDSRVWLPYLDFVLNLNNINFHREQTKLSWDVFAGPAAYLYQTETTFLGNPGTSSESALWTGDLKAAHFASDPDDTETLGDYTIQGTVTVGTALALRLSDRVALEGKVRYIPTNTDWADGEYFQYNGGVSVKSSDNDSNILANLGLTFALGNEETRVQPLWWENPLNFTYPYLQDQYEFDDDYLFADEDGDGVQDRLDKEPDSPCSFVDGGGTAIDSDKDGIVDCNDACPFTPAAQIAEIDENGCTEIIDKHCCDDIDELRRELNQLKTSGVGSCANMTYPSVTFASGSKSVASSQNSAIQSIASNLSANPTCRIVIEGFATGRRKVAQQVAWARAKAVADALADTYGIARSRMIVRYSGVDGYGDVVMVRSARAGESGASNPAAPFPGN